MGLRKKQPSATDELRKVAIAALISALQDAAQSSQPKEKSGRRLGGIRTVAAGGVLFTAGKAALDSGRVLLRERVASEPRDEDEYDDEEYGEEEYDEELEAEADEDEYDEEDEPEAEADEDEYDDEAVPEA